MEAQYFGTEVMKGKSASYFGIQIEMAEAC